MRPPAGSTAGHLPAVLLTSCCDRTQAQQTRLDAVLPAKIHALLTATDHAMMWGTSSGHARVALDDAAAGAEAVVVIPFAFFRLPFKSAEQLVT